MLDIGWHELLIVGVVALLVVGPKDLPHVVRTVSSGIKKIRGLASEFQKGMDEMVRETELADLRKEVEKNSGLSIADELKKQIDPGNDLAKSIDPTEELKSISRDFNKSTRENEKDPDPAAAESAAGKPVETASAPEPAPEQAAEPAESKASATAAEPAQSEAESSTSGNRATG